MQANGEFKSGKGSQEATNEKGQKSSEADGKMTLTEKKYFIIWKAVNVEITVSGLLNS